MTPLYDRISWTILVTPTILPIIYTTTNGKVKDELSHNTIDITELKKVKYDDDNTKNVNNIAWRVILVDAPEGYNPSTPGRMQSMYVTYNLVRSSLQYQLDAFNKHKDSNSISKDDIVVHVFVHDTNRMESQYAKIAKQVKTDGKPNDLIDRLKNSK
eukprot:1127384_1